MKLGPAEREFLIGATDDDPFCRIYVDAPSRLARKLLSLAQAWGATPQRLGDGFQFELPLRAIRFARPRQLTEAQLAQRRRAATASRTARNGLRINGAPLGSGESPAGDGAGAVWAGQGRQP